MFLVEEGKDNSTSFYYQFTLFYIQIMEERHILLIYFESQPTNSSMYMKSNLPANISVFLFCLFV